jgi:hypothetical protein
MRRFLRFRAAAPLAGEPAAQQRRASEHSRPVAFGATPDLH